LVFIGFASTGSKIFVPLACLVIEKSGLVIEGPAGNFFCQEVLSFGGGTRLTPTEGRRPNRDQCAAPSLVVLGDSLAAEPSIEGSGARAAEPSSPSPPHRALLTEPTSQSLPHRALLTEPSSQKIPHRALLTEPFSQSPPHRRAFLIEPSSQKSLPHRALLAEPSS
jgi:hypothetical protein